MAATPTSRYHRAREGDETVREIPAGKQLKLEKRHWLKPFVDEERHHQQRTANKHQANETGIQPVQTITLQKADHKHRDCRISRQESRPVEKTESFEFEGVRRKSLLNRHTTRHPKRHDLPERHSPTDVLRPQRGERCAERRSESRGECVPGEPVQLHLRRKVAQRHDDQHRRKASAGDPLQNPQHIKRKQVRRERAKDPKEHRGDHGGDRESLQREGDPEPRSKHHRSDVRRLEQHGQPGPVVMSDREGALNVIHRKRGDLFVEYRE